MRIICRENEFHQWIKIGDISYLRTEKVEIILDGSLDEPKPKLDGNKITTFPPVLILTKAAEMASDRPFPWSVEIKEVYFRVQPEEV